MTDFKFKDVVRVGRRAPNTANVIEAVTQNPGASSPEIAAALGWNGFMKESQRVSSGLSILTSPDRTKSPIIKRRMLDGKWRYYPVNYRLPGEPEAEKQRPPAPAEKVTTTERLIQAIMAHPDGLTSAEMQALPEFSSLSANYISRNIHTLLRRSATRVAYITGDDGVKRWRPVGEDAERSSTDDTPKTTISAAERDRQLEWMRRTTRYRATVGLYELIASRPRWWTVAELAKAARLKNLEMTGPMISQRSRSMNKFPSQPLIEIKATTNKPFAEKTYIKVRALPIEPIPAPQPEQGPESPFNRVIPIPEREGAVTPAEAVHAELPPVYTPTWTGLDPVPDQEAAEIDRHLPTPFTGELKAKLQQYLWEADDYVDKIQLKKFYNWVKERS